MPDRLAHRSALALRSAAHRVLTAVQVGYQPVAANFFYYSAIVFLQILISETLGMLCSGAFRAELTGAIVLQALYVPLLMFVGFFQVRPAACSAFFWVCWTLWDHSRSPGAAHAL